MPFSFGGWRRRRSATIFGARRMAVWEVESIALEVTMGQGLSCSAVESAAGAGSRGQVFGYRRLVERAHGIGRLGAERPQLHYHRRADASAAWPGRASARKCAMALWFSSLASPR